MPELQFKGKEFVYNHHLTVPFRPLVMDADKGIGAPRTDGNLIIHGDNLHALKALLPTHAGKVDCIFIDPPYNTGNEGWCYNDNVNSPMIKEWLAANPIGLEDGLRHDKWACMMWPRLKLLHELLSDDGSLWMTLDDNEMHNARAILEEIFGEQNFVANVIWQKRFSPSNDELYISTTHDNLLVFAKRKEGWSRQLFGGPTTTSQTNQKASDRTVGILSFARRTAEKFGLRQLPFGVIPRHSTKRTYLKTKCGGANLVLMACRDLKDFCMKYVTASFHNLCGFTARLAITKARNKT